MPQYWFRQKRFGYGATPNTWQGWLWIIASLVLIVGTLVGAQFISDIPLRLLMLVTVPAVIIIVMIHVARLKTEGGWRWRWGD